MNRRLLCISFAALLALPAESSATEQIRVTSQASLARYQPLVSAIYKQMGYEAVFVDMPSERALQEVNAGSMDADMGRIQIQGQSYPGLRFTQEPILEIGITGWVKRGHPIRVKSMHELRNFRIGIVVGHKSTEKLQADLSTSADRAPNIQSLARMLDAERFDIAIMPDAADPTELDAIGTRIDIGAPRYQAYHVFSARHADLVPQWDKTLREFKHNGQYEKLLSGR